MGQRDRRVRKLGPLSIILIVAVGSTAGCVGDPTVDTAGPIVLAATAVQIVGTSDGIASARDLEVMPDGSVWILNSVEPYFLHFGPDGREVGRHGVAGGGPDEFRMPAGFLVGGLDGEVWVLDHVRHAFIRVSEPEGPWAQIDLPPDAVPPGSVHGGMNLMSQTVRTARFGRELLVPWSTATLQDGLPAYHSSLLLAHLAAIDPGTGTVRDVVFLRDVLEDPSVGFVATDGGFPLWYRLWAVCGDDLRVHDRVRNELRGFTAFGDEVEAVHLPPVTLAEVTPEEFARAVFPLRQAEVTGGVGSRLTERDSLRLVGELAGRLEGTPRQLAAYLPRYVDFRCSDQGVMWLQPIDLEAGGLQGSRTWLRVEADGTERWVTFPRGFDPLRFVADRVWGVQRDELDVASVAWVDLARALRSD